MKRYLIITMMIVGCGPRSGNDNSHLRSPQYPPVDYVERMQAYQDSVNNAFITGANGVLSDEDLRHPHDLEFYPPNASYRVPARFEGIDNGEVFLMETSTDRLPEYRRFGVLHFTLYNRELKLHLYQNLEYPDYLFCPFKDKTNGDITYGAGRYLDFELKDTLDPVIDFNYAYNPLCAYNERYSCPIPPYENHLDVAIEAGVKKWH